MHQSGSAGNLAGSTRARKEKRFTYVLNGGDGTKHSSAVNCLAVFKPSFADGCDYLFTGSRDGTLKRWALCEETATCSATFESHTDWVNDVITIGDKTLISCSSDTTVKVWDCFSGGSCCRTLRQHSDYVNCLAAAEENRTLFASGGLGGEVFIWDVEASVAPLIKSDDQAEGDSSQSNGYVPIAAKGHKESVYALAMDHTGNLLVSGGTEKVVRLWDPRTGSKTIKLRGNTDNIRALLLDSNGRFCLSGSSDSMIRLWDIGQQRCVHSYSVHTDSVWALSSTPTFGHVYSGGRDMSLYLTDLNTRESILLCRKEHPILHLKLHDNCIWVASTDSSVERWPAEACNPKSLLERGGSFLAGNFPFLRARVPLEGLAPVPVYEEPLSTITGSPSMVQHEILNNRRHILTKDTAGSVKLWEITRGFMVADYGQVSFEEKKEELSEMISVPAWFTADTRLGSLSINLDAPQCFSAEAYSEDLNIVGRSEDDKVNLGQETLKGLLAHWLTQRSQRVRCCPLTNNDMPSGKGINCKRLSNSRAEDETPENEVMVYPPFAFSTVSPPSIITEGSQGVPWRKKITDLDGSEDERDFPMWCLDCILHSHLPSRENTKCYFYLQPSEDSPLQIPSQGKLNAPRIFRIYKVVTYIIEKMVLDKQLDSMDGDGTLAVGSKPWQKLRHSIEILCNNEILTPDMSLATVRAYIWKKPEDIVLNYRIGRDRMVKCPSHFEDLIDGLSYHPSLEAINELL